MENFVTYRGGKCKYLWGELHLFALFRYTWETLNLLMF